MSEQNVLIDMCDECLHLFPKLPDHPKHDGKARCPYCMSIGLDAARAPKPDRPMLSDERINEIWKREWSLKRPYGWRPEHGAADRLRPRLHPRRQRGSFMSTDNQSAQSALAALLRYAEARECTHETTYRGGAIWTICHECGKKWADDEGGFKPYQEPPEIANARSALAQAPAPSGEALPTEFHDALKGLAYTAMSWNGFNVFGDEKSIKEVARTVHVAGTAPQLQDEIKRLQSATPPTPEQAGPSGEALALCISVIDATLANSKILPSVKTAVAAINAARAALASPGAMEGAQAAPAAWRYRFLMPGGPGGGSWRVGEHYPSLAVREGGGG